METNELLLLQELNNFLQELSVETTALGEKAKIAYLTGQEQFENLHDRAYNAGWIIGQAEIIEKVAKFIGEKVRG